MSKNKKHALALRLMIISAFLASFSIILGKLFAINLGEVLRLSFENTPIIFAGAAFGPIVGLAVGAVADILGCLLVGYAINPLVTLGAAAVGAVSGIYRIVMPTSSGPSRYLRVIITVFSAHIVGSVLIKTAGLAAFYAMPYPILMLWRALNYLIVGTLECVIISLLINNRKISREIEKIKGGRRK